jgi:hypothetical protein
MYTLRKQGGFLQVSVEDNDRVSGFVSRYEDEEKATSANGKVEFKMFPRIYRRKRGDEPELLRPPGARTPRLVFRSEFATGMRLVAGTGRRESQASAAWLLHCRCIMTENQVWSDS